MISAVCKIALEPRCLVGVHRVCSSYARASLVARLVRARVVLTATTLRSGRGSGV